MNLPILTAGFDPTVAPTVPTNSQLLQMVQAAHVATGIGIIYWGASAPNLVTYPDAETALWGKTSAGVPTGEFFYWDGVAWAAFTITSLDGSKLIDASVTLDKLSTAGAATGDVIYFNGVSLAFANVLETLTDNTLPIAKLIKPTSGTGQYLYYNGTALEWHNITSAEVLALLTGADIVALLAAQSVPISKLTIGSARYILRTNAAGTALEFAAPATLFNDYELSPLVIGTDTALLTIVAGVITVDAGANNGGPAYIVTLNTNISDFNVTNLQSGREIIVIIEQDATGNRTLVWDSAIEWLNTTSPTILAAANSKTLVRFVNVDEVIYGQLLTVDDSAVKVSAEYTCVRGDIHTFAHNLGQTPRYVRAVLKCLTAQHGYAVGDEISFEGVWDASVTYLPAIKVRANATNIIISNCDYGVGTSLYTVDADGTTPVTLTRANWAAVVYYSL